MSVGSNLQEMENVVTKGAAASEVMPKSGSNASGVSTPGQTGSYEDLGGPTPENYKVDDNSAKLAEPKIATVKDIVNRGAKPADPMPKGMKEEEEVAGEVVEEEETTASAEDVVSEEETSEEEVVSEEGKSPKQNITSKKMLKHCLPVKNFPKNSKRKHVPFLKLLSKQKLPKFKKN